MVLRNFLPYPKCLISIQEYCFAGRVKMELKDKGSIFGNDSFSYIYKLHNTIDDVKDFRNYNLNRRILKYLKGKSLLDIGCGSGYLLYLAKKRGLVCKGIEPNKSLIDLAKKTYRINDIALGFADKINKFGRFDTITLIDVLEHVKNDSILLKDIHTHLGDKGRLIILVPVFRLLYGKRDRLSGHYRRYSKKEIIQKLKKQKFKILKARYWNMISFFPYLFYEIILGKEVPSKLRNKQKNFFGKIISFFLFYWFKYIENNINFGFGLSLFVVAEK